MTPLVYGICKPYDSAHRHQKYHVDDDGFIAVYQPNGTLISCRLDEDDYDYGAWWVGERIITKVLNNMRTTYYLKIGLWTPGVTNEPPKQCFNMRKSYYRPDGITRFPTVREI